jgi:hypothetical protein
MHFSFQCNLFLWELCWVTVYTFFLTHAKMSVFNDILGSSCPISIELHVKGCIYHSAYPQPYLLLFILMCLNQGPRGVRKLLEPKLLKFHLDDADGSLVRALNDAKSQFADLVCMIFLLLFHTVAYLKQIFSRAV